MERFSISAYTEYALSEQPFSAYEATEDTEGEWVRYDDAQAEIERLRAALQWQVAHYDPTAPELLLRKAKEALNPPDSETISKKEYSGRTTCYEHKHGDIWRETPGAGKDCIQEKTVFEVQWSNCPVEVEKEVRRLWRENEYGNDVHYYSWNDEDDDSDAEGYPIIAEYLRSRGINRCLIHWWW